MRHKTGEGKRRKVRHKHRKDNLGSKTGKKNSKKLGKTLRPKKKEEKWGRRMCVHVYRGKQNKLLAGWVSIDRFCPKLFNSGGLYIWPGRYYWNCWKPQFTFVSRKSVAVFFPRREANNVLNLAVRHFHRMARLLGLQKDQFLWLYFI